MTIFDKHSGQQNFQTTTKSDEEEDHLVRSTKKIKSSNSSEHTDLENEVEMAHATSEGNSPQILPLQEPLPTKSFKEALTTNTTRDYMFDNGVELLSSDEEDEDHEGTTSTDNFISEHMGLPQVSLPIKLLQKIRKPWESALIIRLLGKSIGYTMLCTRVKNI
ncbi:hypothetical protein ACSBR2_025008 [Camellia fascicularis]